MTEDLHRVYLVPGLFGFAKLASYDYFHHVRQSIVQLFAEAGTRCETFIVRSPPTSSLRYRARILAEQVASTSGAAGPIHLLGHSTGGLDARLVLSPDVRLDLAPGALDWRPRVASCVTVNTPHFGTPLAGHFATVSGTRLLYLLSLLTIFSLAVGEPSLAIVSRLLSGVGGVERVLLGDDRKLVSRITDALLRIVDEDGRREINEFLGKIRIDQGGIIQLMPEAMDLFNATTRDAPGVRYGYVASVAPAPRPTRFLTRLLSPWALMTATLYATAHQLSSRRPSMYKYAELTAEEQGALERALDRRIDDTISDGIVPTRSMVWGELVHGCEADHLDVLGHFHDNARPQRHVDWVTSGASFTRTRFAWLMEAVARFQLGARGGRTPSSR